VHHLACTLSWLLQTFIYLAGLQLLLTGGLPCVVAGAAGVVAGLVYRTNLLGIRKYVGSSQIGSACKL
jgi:hypothetical protein